eukprot:5127472-Ditylum_brightwellii.AAC.1
MGGEYDFPDDRWENISEDAKDLIRSLLVTDPAKRLTPTEALQCRWFDTDTDAADAPLGEQQTFDDVVLNFLSEEARGYDEVIIPSISSVDEKPFQKLKADCGNVFDGFSTTFTDIMGNIEQEQERVTSFLSKCAVQAAQEAHLFEECMAIQKKIMGEDHIDAANTLHELAL